MNSLKAEVARRSMGHPTLFIYIRDESFKKYMLDVTLYVAAAAGSLKRFSVEDPDVWGVPNYRGTPLTDLELSELVTLLVAFIKDRCYV